MWSYCPYVGCGLRPLVDVNDHRAASELPLTERGVDTVGPGRGRPSSSCHSFVERAGAGLLQGGPASS